MNENAVVAQDVHKRYGEVLALDGVDLEVRNGAIYGLLGPNGAGKTTMVKVLTTLTKPDQGHASVLGHDVVREASTVRHLIGLAGQYAALDPILTGRENLVLIGRLLQMTKSAAQDRAAVLLDRFDLSDAADRAVKTYSGGMRRRLDLAAALLHQPPVVFLDEPTTGLDPESRAELWDVIRELVDDGATLLLTTQYLEEADRLCDRIAVVNHGKMIEEGTPRELKARMGSTVIELQFPTSESASQARDAIGESARIAPGISGATVQVTSNDGSRMIMDLLRKLDSQGMAPDTLAVREPSLDDVFLALTGRKAEDGASGAPQAGRRGRR